MDFNGKHICVTGASSGIGLVTARMLVQRGARVSLIARRRELLDEVVAELGPNAAGFPADVGDKASLEAALDAAAAHFGPIEALFANAGLRRSVWRRRRGRRAVGGGASRVIARRRFVEAGSRRGSAAPADTRRIIRVSL